MSSRAVGSAATVYVAYKVYRYLTTSKHDNVLKRRYDEFIVYTSNNCTLKVDHISPWGNDGRPETYNGHRPDLVLRGFDSPNIIVEVETQNSLDATARAQLEAFKKPGYTRVLVVPGKANPQARGLVSSLGGEVVVSSPAGLREYL